MSARLFHAIDEHYSDISAELGPWNEALMSISGSARITVFVWSRRSLLRPPLRKLVIAIRVVTVIYTLIFMLLLLGFFAAFFVPIY